MSADRRSLKLFCVGLPKSGTHSVAAIFERRFRTAHEPTSEDCMDMVMKLAEGVVSDGEVTTWLRRRDESLQLEVESSFITALLAKHVVNALPAAKFVLTFREPVSWLDSMINHHLAKRNPDLGSIRARFRDFRFRSHLVHPPEEAPLKCRNLYTLDGYFGYWSHHAFTVLSGVPKERLLVLRTGDIASSLNRIASFAEVDAADLSSDKTHEYSNPMKFNVVAEIQASHLRAKMEEHCEKLLNVLSCVKEHAPLRGSEGPVV